MSEDEPKSAYEIAMEKLRVKDIEEGKEPATVTAEQKEKIAEIRQECEAKVAELEIMHRSRMMQALRQGDPEEALEKIDESYRRDRQKLEEEKETRIAKVRRGEKT